MCHFPFSLPQSNVAARLNDIIFTLHLLLVSRTQHISPGQFELSARRDGNSDNLQAIQLLWCEQLFSFFHFCTSGRNVKVDWKSFYVNFAIISNIQWGVKKINRSRLNETDHKLNICFTKINFAIFVKVYESYLTKCLCNVFSKN